VLLVDAEGVWRGCTRPRMPHTDTRDVSLVPRMTCLCTHGCSVISRSSFALRNDEYPWKSSRSK